MDNQVDIYLSNLVLIHTPNHNQMLREAYRVLKPGGKAAISIWGVKSHTSFFTVYSDSISKFNSVQGGSKNSGYDLHDNIDSLKQVCQDIGFINFRKEYTNAILDISNPEDFEKKLCTPSGLEMINDFPEDKKNKILEEIRKEKERFLISDKFVNLNILIISLTKPGETDVNYGIQNNLFNNNNSNSNNISSNNNNNNNINNIKQEKKQSVKAMKKIKTPVKSNEKKSKEIKSSNKKKTK